MFLISSFELIIKLIEHIFCYNYKKGDTYIKYIVYIYNYNEL